MKNIIYKIKQNGGFVNAHSHIDRSNTSHYFSKSEQYLFLKEKWKLVDKIKSESSFSSYKKRMLKCIQDQKEFGVTALLSFIDIDDVAGFRAIEAAAEVRSETQINFKIACQTLKGVLNKKYESMIEQQMHNIDIIGSLPSADVDKALHLDKVMSWAKKYNKRLHVHVDQLNTSEEKETELLARKTIQWGLEEKVTAVHSISLACHTKDYRNEVYKMSRDAGLSFVSCPSAWIDHPRREDLAPIHNSITPADELIENDLIVAIGSDNIMDVYKPYCDGNMLFELRMLLEACKIYDEDQLVKIATTNGKKVLGIKK
jgi:cytosine/creatinine deaminase